MLTKRNPDGTWSYHGVDFSEVSRNVYGALCKLRDYEKSDFKPDDLDLVIENIQLVHKLRDMLFSGYGTTAVLRKIRKLLNPMLYGQLIPMVLV